MKIIQSIVYAMVLSMAVGIVTVLDGQASYAQSVQAAMAEAATQTVWVAPEQTPPPYDEDYVLRVITAEGGTDQLVCNGVTQCLYNACERDLWAHSVEYIIEEYQYTTPAEWVSDEARNAFDAVFCSGVTFVDFGDALYFYAPAYCESEWHESLPFVIEVGGVRFFEEGME